MFKSEIIEKNKYQSQKIKKKNRKSKSRKKFHPKPCSKNLDLSLLDENRKNTRSKTNKATNFLYQKKLNKFSCLGKDEFMSSVIQQKINWIKYNDDSIINFSTKIIPYTVEIVFKLNFKGKLQSSNTFSEF